jgi:hypothetical protein
MLLLWLLRCAGRVSNSSREGLLTWWPKNEVAFDIFNVVV